MSKTVKSKTEKFLSKIGPQSEKRRTFFSEVTPTRYQTQFLCPKKTRLVISFFQPGLSRYDTRGLFNKMLWTPFLRKREKISKYFLVNCFSLN